MKPFSAQCRLLRPAHWTFLKGQLKVIICRTESCVIRSCPESFLAPDGVSNLLCDPQGLDQWEDDRAHKQMRRGREKGTCLLSGVLPFVG